MNLQAPLPSEGGSKLADASPDASQAHLQWGEVKRFERTQPPKTQKGLGFGVWGLGLGFG